MRCRSIFLSLIKTYFYSVFLEKRNIDCINNVKSRPNNICFFILLLFLQIQLFGSISEQADTSRINELNREAYNSARSNPSVSISKAQIAFSLSQGQNYKKGAADASLALGAAYLAKHNPGDSASYYFNRALDIYEQLNDLGGQGQVCYSLSYLYSFAGNPDSALHFGKQSIKFFEQGELIKESISALAAVIYLERQIGNSEEAFRLSEKAIETAIYINDTIQWANALNDQGNIFKDMFLFNQAIDAYFLAYELWEASNNSTGLATAYGSIANAYFFQEDYRKSLEFNFKKLEIVSLSANKWETNKTLNNIALSYGDLGKYDSALIYMRQGLQLALIQNYPEGLAKSYDGMSSTFLKMGEADSALFYSSKAVNITKKNNSKLLASCLVDQAAALERKEQYQRALSAAKEAHGLAEHNQDTHTLSAAAFLLSEIYNHLNRRDLAYPFLTEYLKLNDSINNKAFMRKVTRLDIQHEYDKKQRITQHEIELLNKDNQIKTARLHRTWILTIALFLLTAALSTIGVLTIRNKNHRIEQMNLEMRNFLLEVEDLKLAIADKKEWENNKINELLEKYEITDREADVLHMISHGYNNPEIAEKLFISINTVKYHIKNLYLKLDAKNRVEIINRFSPEELTVS